MATESERRRDTADAVEALRRETPELATLFDAIRAEFDAKVSALKAWGVAMCVCGGAVGGFTATVTELTHPGAVSQAVGLLPFL